MLIKSQKILKKYLTLLFLLPFYCVFSPETKESKDIQSKRNPNLFIQILNIGSWIPSEWQTGCLGSEVKISKIAGMSTQ